MNWSIPLLRVRGIDIKVHLTFVLILVWAAYYWGADADNGFQGALYGIAVKDITLLPIVGLLTLDDLLRGLRDQPAATVGDAMRREFPVTRSEDPVTAAQGQFGAGRVRALPVVQSDGRLAGLLTAADIGEAFRLLIAQPKLGAASVVPRPPTVEQVPF